MTSTYDYKGIDITLDVFEKVRDVVSLVAQKNGEPFESAYARFASSGTYESLVNPKTLMWSESVPFILAEYDAEAK